MKKQQAHCAKNGNLNKRIFLDLRLNHSSTIYTYALLICLSISFVSCSNRDEPGPEIIEPKTLNENVQIRNQQELTDFINQKITHINGHLTIGYEADENRASNNGISDLSELNILSEVSGNLTILGNQELMTLKGLENLKRVGGQLTIAFNPKLAELQALEDLESISGALAIEFNDNLTSIEALGNLRGITSFSFVRNPLVTELFQFNPNTILQVLSVEGNERLSDLKGLSEVSIFDLKIIANPTLNDLQGLEGATHLQSAVILQNEALESLTGLTNLKRIEHTLHIEENPMLVNLDGMGLLEHGPIILRVVKNERLQSFDRFTMTPIVSDEFIWVNIQSNPELLDINPLKELVSLDQIQIYDNGKLNDLQPLSNLQYVKHLNIIYNKALTNLSGLEQLTLVEILSISGNQNLQSLEGLNNLQSVSNVMHIVDNQSLTDLCALKSLAENSSLPQDQNLSFNAFNPSIEDIKLGNCSN